MYGHRLDNRSPQNAVGTVCKTRKLQKSTRTKDCETHISFGMANEEEIAAWCEQIKADYSPCDVLVALGRFKRPNVTY